MTLMGEPSNMTILEIDTPGRSSCIRPRRSHAGASPQAYIGFGSNIRLALEPSRQHT